MPPITSETRFWKVAPGEGAHLWNLCRRDHIIAIGWPTLGDIRNLTRDEFLAKKLVVHDENNAYTPDGMDQLWKFVHEIKPGDRIVANQGFSKVVGIGVVIGDCEYVEGEWVHYRHRWPVEWYDTRPRKVEQGGWMRTLISLHEKVFHTVETAPLIEEEKYYKLAPQANCWSWEECVSKNLAILGYDDLNDVSQMNPKIEFAAKLANRDPGDPKIDCRAVWELSQLRRGSHLVAVDRQSGEVLGYGLVTGEYFYDAEAPRFRHRVPVQWQTAQLKVNDRAARRKTLEEIQKTQWSLLGGPSSPDTVINAPIKKTMSQIFPLNQILYGSPGTGKTYNSIECAVSIIDSKESASRSEAKIRFDELFREGRIGFVTFHQSFGYEDFVEGIRPVMGEEAASVAHYEIRDGVLKEMALKAIASSLEREAGEPQFGPTFDLLWEELIRLIEDNAPYEIDGVKSSRYKLSLSPRGNLFGDNIHGTAQQPYNASRTNIEKVWRQLPVSENPTHNKLHAIIRKGSHTNLIGAAILELRRIRDKWKPAEHPVAEEPQMLTPDDAQAFLDGSPDYKFVPDGPRYVLIIDEINRGNVSRILGELTLPRLSCSPVRGC